VTALAFLFVMTNKFEIDQIQVEVLSELCQDKDDGLVDYTKIEDILDNPQRLYARFVAEE
jgi:hypothetical protein